MTHIRDRLYTSYSNFEQLLANTFAIQTYEMMRDLPEEYRAKVIKSQSDKILENNKDILYITITDANNNIIYSSEEDLLTKPKGTKNIASSQIVDNLGKVVGKVEIGLSADTAGIITKTTRNSMLAVFTLMWFAFTLVIITSTFFITRELTILHHGVREISSGKFGTVLDYSQTSGETKELFEAFNDMSRRLRSYEEQNIDTITLEKNKLEAVLMSIANGVVVCDNYDKISIINNAARKILNIKSDIILNTQIQDYYDSNGAFCFKDKIALFKNTPLDIMEKKPLEFNIEIDTRVIKSIMSPIYSKVHDYLGYIIILIDVTKEAEVEKLKNDFISNVSHELRTPVTVLRSYADTLYNYGENFKYEEQKEFIGTINQEIIRLNRMVNDVLDFSKLQNDNKLEKTTQNIASTIENTVNSLKVLAQEKGITFSVMKEPDLPDTSYNTDSIERALSNLITNAIKYSHNNSRVKIRAELAKNADFIEVSIEDFGVGIATEHLEKIYDRFYRIENDAHTIKGTGLGLHLVKIAVETHHNGEVFVSSKLNEGSIFGFRLPITDSETMLIAPKVVESQTDETEQTPVKTEDDWEITFEVRETEAQTNT